MAKKITNKCKWDEVNCDLQRMPNPAKSGKFHPFCVDHQIMAVLRQKKAEVAQQAEELEKMRQELKNEANKGYDNATWRVVTRYILLVNSDSNLMVACSTNPKLRYKVTDKRIQGGHYFRADKYPAIKYDIRNIMPQSLQENKHFAGNQEAMAMAIESRYGQGVIAELEKLKDGPELTAEQIVEVRKHYTILMNEELTRRGIRNPWAYQRR